MAVVTISNNNTRRQDMEGASSTTNIGAGPSANATTEKFYQGAQAWARRPNSASAERGFWVTVTSINMTVANDGVLLHKSFILNDSAIETVANGGGLRARVGSSQSNYNEYILKDDGTQGDNGEFNYGQLGIIITPIDPSVTAWIDAQPGTAPTLTAVTEVAVTGSTSAISNVESIGLDAIDFGPGLYLVGGDGADADGLWQDFIDDDEGTQTAGRFGHVRTVEGVLYVFGTLFVGRNSTPTTTATVLTDSQKTLVFPGGLVDVGYNGLFYDLGNANTAATLNQMNYIGRGRDNRKVWFDSAAEVDGTNEELDITAHGLNTGDAVLYSDEGGTAVSGLTDVTEYFVERVTADTLSLHTTRQGAFTAGTPINLTAAGTGQHHSLRRQPDTRPDVEATGTLGDWTETASLFLRCRNVTLTSASTLDACTLVACNLITVNDNAVMADCVVDGFTLAEGEYAVTTPDLDDISGGEFIQGDEGHAIRRSGTAASDTLSGVTFTGYWTHGGDAGAGAEFSTSATGVDGVGNDITTTNTHGFSTGDAVYYNDNGGVASIGLTDGVRYYVNVISTTNISFHVTRRDAINDLNRVSLTASGTETHTFYSSKAAILNDTGGAMTISIVGGGNVPTVRNIGAGTATVTAAVSVTVTPVFIGTEIRAYQTGTNVEVDGVENTVGTSFALSLTSGQSVDIKIHSAPTASRPNDTPAIPIQINNISFTVDQDLVVAQQRDRNFFNP